jgi:drug/metabolite transporter superfamily protein YnfA
MHKTAQQESPPPTHHHEATFLFDWVGLGLSGLCLVHCLAMPILISLLPLLELVAEEQSFHFWMAGLIIPVGSLAFWRGFLRHANKSIVVIGLVGLALITSGIFVHSVADQWGRVLTITGGIFLIIAHFRNWRASRCRACHKPQGSQLNLNSASNAR